MKDGAPVQVNEDLSEVDVGGLLRYTREQYGQTIQDIERALRIRGIQIEAIERGDVDSLPGRVYVIGFVRTYAEYLGLDGGEIVKLYKLQYMDSQPNKVALSFPLPASESKTPSMTVVIGSLAVMAVLLLGWNSLSSSPEERNMVSAVQPVPEEISSRFEEEPVVSAPPAVVQESPQEQQESVPPASPESSEQKGIILNILENSWVEIKDGEGKVIVSNVLDKGDQYFVPDSPGLNMSLGNAGGVEIVLDGRVLKPLGKIGDIRRDIPLETDYLKTLEFKEPALQPDVQAVSTDGGGIPQGESVQSPQQ